MEHIDEFLSVLTIALDTLYYKDQYLINHESMQHTKDSKHISELSISHKLGHYLALLITEYDVDCEYNRNKDDKKIMEKSHIRPDIIIHERGSNEHNFAVIEIKPWWNSDDTLYDEKKLAFLTSTDCDFKYKYGLSLIIKENREDTKVKIFIDGKIDNVY